MVIGVCIYGNGNDDVRPAATGLHYSTLFQTLIQPGRPEDAAAILRDWEVTFPESRPTGSRRVEVSFIQGDLAGAEEHARKLTADLSRPTETRVGGFVYLARLAYWAGRLDDARALLLQAEAVGLSASAIAQWNLRRDAAYDEALVGDRDWARIHLREALQDELNGDLPFAGGSPTAAALLAASSGDSEAATIMIKGWESRTPEERRGPTEIARSRLASLAAGAPRDAANAVEAMHRILGEMGCSEACQPFFQATLYDQLGEYRRAAELYERILLPGYFGWGFNTSERLHAMMRLGPLYEEMSDPVRAVEAYQRMVDQWREGDARALEKVGRFKDRIAALRE